MDFYSDTAVFLQLPFHLGFRETSVFLPGTWRVARFFDCYYFFFCLRGAAETGDKNKFKFRNLVFVLDPFVEENMKVPEVPDVWAWTLG